MAGAVTLREGVIVDPGAGTAFVPGRDGGIDAIDLASGSVLWNTEEAAKPLYVADGVLLAQRVPTGPGSLELALLDARSGRLRNASTVEIEPEAWASVEDRPASIFRTSAAAVAGGVVLSWQQVSAPEDGALRGYLPAETEGRAPAIDGDEQRLGAGQRAGQRPAAVERTGSARVDLRTGAVSALPEQQRDAQASTLRVGTVLADVEGRQLQSQDGRHVLVSERIEQPADPWSVYRWSIYEVTGALVGRFDSAISMAPFVVDRGGVVFVHPPGVVATAEGLVEQPLSLHHVDASSGVRMWTRAIRELEYRGPVAP